MKEIYAMYVRWTQLGGRKESGLEVSAQLVQKRKGLLEWKGNS